jgi:membrane-bound lytic murein transglycosylase MltF
LQAIVPVGKKAVIGLLYLALMLLLTAPCAHAQATLENSENPEDAILQRVTQLSTSDLPAIQKNRFIRVLVAYSKTNYFVDLGHARGFEYEMLKNYEKYLNKDIKDTINKMQMVFIPTPFSELLDMLNKGLGDIAAAGLTITPERQDQVQFSDPYIPDVSEVVVVNKNIKEISSLDDLAGRKVFVRKGSSYVGHLKALSDKMVAAGKKPILIDEADPILATEDILEMVNAGIVPVTVADFHIAEAWAQVLPNIVALKELSVNTGGRIAWAVRKNNPKLVASLNTYLKDHKKGSLLGNILFKRYYDNTKWIKNPVTKEERKRLDAFIAIFQKYSGKYGFDWLAVAAQAYQESGLDHSKKSPAGAIGIMQLLPSTAADKNVGIPDIAVLENNVHAGVKYLNFMREYYFNDPKISPAAQIDFSWAAYNAGPARVNSLREKAAKRGFDANVWFGNVEKIAAEVIGRETVMYVANINKYYIAYKLIMNAEMEKKKLLEGPQTADMTPTTDSGESEPVEPIEPAESVEPAEPVDQPPAMEATENAVPSPKEPQQWTAKNSLKLASKKSTPKITTGGSGSNRYHTVKPGETLYRISQKYGLSVEKIMHLNKLNSTALKPGDRINLGK